MNLDLFRTWLVARTTKTERGANLVEYILLVAFIALLVIAAVVFLRQQIGDEFSEAGNCLNNANSITGNC
ncbi:MAG TPA: hypothetical protein VNN07_07245 [Candidatus Tectomicrobia bacterium]|nr:MAG: hypothetical protein KatS3mg009_2173 [Acidimicrobiia bacterium]HXH82709.1 hypothetical protein [Candidatus Tectomicrobia bacterium]